MVRPVRTRKNRDRERCTHSLGIAERGDKSVHRKKATGPGVGARTSFRPQRKKGAKTKIEKHEKSQTRDTEGKTDPILRVTFFQHQVISHAIGLHYNLPRVTESTLCISLLRLSCSHYLAQSHDGPWNGTKLISSLSY